MDMVMTYIIIGCSVGFGIFVSLVVIFLVIMSIFVIIGGLDDYMQRSRHGCL